MMDWTQVLTIVGSNLVLILMMFGTNVAIWMHTDKKIDAIRQDSRDFHQVMAQESKEFHGRLERQDAEFKAHILHQHKEGR